MAAVGRDFRLRGGAGRGDAKPLSSKHCCQRTSYPLKTPQRDALLRCAPAVATPPRRCPAPQRRPAQSRPAALRRGPPTRMRSFRLPCPPWRHAHTVAQRVAVAMRGPEGAGVVGGSGPAEVCAPADVAARVHLRAHYRRHGTLARAAAVCRACGVRRGAHRCCGGGGSRRGGGCWASSRVRQAASEGAPGHPGGARGGVQGLQRESRPRGTRGGGLALADQGTSLLARAAALRLRGALSRVAFIAGTALAAAPGRCSCLVR